MKAMMIDARKVELNRVPFHSELTPDQQTLCRATWNLIRDASLYPSYEQWEYGFLLDMHPETELRVWIYIGNRYRASVQQMTEDGRPPNQETRLEMISRLASLTTFPLDHPMRKKLDREYQALVVGKTQG